MNILYACHRIPYPPHKGDKIRSFHQIRHLAKRHGVHLFALADRRSDLDFAAPLRGFCRTVEVVYLDPRLARLKALAALAGSGPMTLPYFHATRLKRKIREAIKRRNFDVAVAYSSGMLPYLLEQGIPLAIDFVDLDSQQWLQYAASSKPPWKWMYALEGRRLFEYEKYASARAEVSILVTAREGRVLEEQGAPRRLEAVPLGVDLDHYRLDLTPDPELASLPGPKLIFVGFMAYRPNVEAVIRIVKRILPAVASALPKILFVAVGADPPKAVRDLHDGRTVFVTGRVEDPRPYLRAADLALVPLDLGRGIQTKVLEAMAMNLPVVLTEQAASGVGAEPGRDYLVAKSDEELARAVLVLLKDRERASALAAAGRRFVKEHFGWEDKLLRYEKILEEIASSRTQKDGQRLR